MDTGDMSAAMGGFFLGQMFAGQTQAKPALFHFASIRVDRKENLLDVLAEVLKDAFLNIPQETELDFELTNKSELKVWRKNKGVMEQPLVVFGLCAVSWTKRDYILTIGLRNEVGAPFPLNMALLRHMLKSMDAKKVKYEIW